MRTIMEEAGGIIIGGVIFLTLITLFSRIGDTARAQSFKDAAQESTTNASDIMEREFRLIGYGYTDTTYILKADSASITFRADLNDDGIVDTVAYGLSAVVYAGQNTTAPRILQRTPGHGLAAPVATGITKFALDYFDRSGNPTTTIANIRSIRMSMISLADADIDSTHPGVYWERTIKPKNMR